MATLQTPRNLAVVTGASSGIGYELAKQFAKHGFDLVVAAEDAGIHAAAREFEQLGIRAEAVQVDLAEYDGVEKLYQTATMGGRPIEIVAINAGVGVAGDFARETSLREELRLIDLNVVSTVHLAKRVSADMVSRGRGRILITASIAALMPTPLEAVYGASKAFDLSFANSLRNELKDTGVTVTAILPGPTDTNFFHRAGMDDTKVGAVESKKNTPEEVARQGFDALMAGKDSVVTGNAITKLEGVSSRFVPEDVKAQKHRKMAEHGSAPKK